MPNRDPMLGKLAKPAMLQPALQLCCSGVTGEQNAGLGIGSPQREHLPRVWIWRTLLGKQIIAIVPERHQAKIMHRCVRSRAIADHDANFSAESRQEGSIAGSGPRFGHQHGEASGTEGLGTGLGEAIKISLVRHDDHCTTAALGAGSGTAGEAKSPVPGGRRAGSYLPHGPRTSTCAKRCQKFRAGGIVQEWSCGLIIWQAISTRLPRCLFCRGVPRRHGKPHHVGECARVMISNLPDQPRDLGAQHRLLRDDLVKWRQRSVMITHGNSIKDEPVTQPSREPYSHPSARHCVRILFRRHRIVERPVQMTERYVDSHPGDREFWLAQFGHTR
jgi:hypothetical protein